MNRTSFPGRHSPTDIECDCGRAFPNKGAYVSHKDSCSGRPVECEYNQRCTSRPVYFTMHVRQIESPVGETSGIKLREKYLCEEHKNLAEKESESEKSDDTFRGEVFYKKLK